MNKKMKNIPVGEFHLDPDVEAFCRELEGGGELTLFQNGEVGREEPERNEGAFFTDDKTPQKKAVGHVPAGGVLA